MNSFVQVANRVSNLNFMGRSPVQQETTSHIQQETDDDILLCGIQPKKKEEKISKPLSMEDDRQDQQKSQKWTGMETHPHTFRRYSRQDVRLLLVPLSASPHHFLQVPVEKKPMHARSDRGRQKSARGKRGRSRGPLNFLNSM